MKIYKLEEILSFYNKDSLIDPTKEKLTHNFTKKKSIANQSNFLNNLQGQTQNSQGIADIINSQKLMAKKSRLVNFGNHIFNISVNNLPEIMEKVIKETNQNQNFQNNFFTELLNKNKKNEKFSSNNSHFVDLLLYFQENNLNFINFCELLSAYNLNFKDEKSKTIYMFILSKVNKLINIKRDHVSNIETINQSKSLFFILEGEESDFNMFFEDSKIINDFLKQNKEDDFELISNLTNRKTIDFLKKSEEFEKAQISSREKNNIILNNNSENVQLNAQSTISNKASDKSNTLLHSIDINKNKELNFFKENNSEINNENNYICKFRVTRILPEAIQNGILLIDKKGFFEFKPLINNYKGKNIRFNLFKINAVLKYRYLYKYKALNIFLYNSKRSKLFDFEEESHCNDFYEYLKANSINLDKNFDNIKYKTNLWIDGFISNYDYLIYLNHMSSRSFTDLSQYPVMPWVLTNFEDNEEVDLTDESNYRDLSKPIGALNPLKYNNLKEKYLDTKSMGSEIPPFLYGSHYSTPATVMFFLIRSVPLFQIRLQNGKFDSADRLFKNIRESWSFALTAQADFKELIPEYKLFKIDFIIPKEIF